MVYMGGFEKVFGYISNHKDIRCADVILATKEEIEENTSVNFDFTHIIVQYIMPDENVFIGSPVTETKLVVN